VLDRTGLGWLGVVWTLGTVGIYTGLYGFSASNRAFVALGVSLFVVTLAASLLKPAVAGWWWRRTHRAYVSGTAEVRAVSPRPGSGTYGRCELGLVVVAPGLPTTEVRVRESRAPVVSWPDVGDSVPVLVDVDDMRRVRVQWPEFQKPQPQPPSEEADAGDEVEDEYELPVFTEEELQGIGFDEAVHGPRRILPLEDEPTTLTARYLFPTERYRGEWRRHWVRPGFRYALTLGLAVAGEILVRRYVPGGYLAAARIGVAVLGGLIALHVLFAWYESRFVLTNKRVMLIEGVLRRRVSMVPLLRVTDMRFEQSLAGRLFGYGDFMIEGMGFLSRIRRITALPSPNELYLRLVEEMYEPAAVEARLGSAVGADGAGGRHLFGEEPRAEALTLAVREAIYGPALANYDGWVSIGVVDVDGAPVPVSDDRQVWLEPGRVYELQVVIDASPVTGVAERLVVTGGVDRDSVVFAAEVDSDQRALRQPARTIEVGPAGGSVTFEVRTPEGGFTESPWLWVRVSQQRRLLQSVELTAVVRVASG